MINLDKITNLIALIRTNRRAQIITASVSITVFSLIASVIIGISTRQKVAYQQPAFFPPSPSPRATTRFANHPTIIKIEQELPDLEVPVQF